MTTNHEQIETAARAIRGTREFRAAAAFGLPDDAHTSYTNALARAVIAAIHPTVTTVEELDALELGSAVLCTGERDGEGDGEQVLILTSGQVMPWRNNWMHSTAQGLLDNYETVTLLHIGGAA